MLSHVSCLSYLPFVQEEKTYELESTFIYDAFQNSWADSMNLVKQNKKNKNGTNVYLDAKNYFRGAAVKDAILTENMDDFGELQTHPPNTQWC